eukprot:431932-Lingulodinium_polyedra.AAC.1
MTMRRGHARERTRSGERGAGHARGAARDRRGMPMRRGNAHKRTRSWGRGAENARAARAELVRRR